MSYRVRNIGIAVALAVLAALLTIFYVSNYKKSVQHGEDLVPVWVAASDISVGTAGSEVGDRNLLRAVEIAAKKQQPLFFKLHPNENRVRSTREIERWAPGAKVFYQGSAEEMVANASTLICQYSTLAFVGLALGKEVHSYFGVEKLKKLLPLQCGGAAAVNIAEVCRGLLAESPASAKAGDRESAMPTAEAAL